MSYTAHCNGNRVIVVVIVIVVEHAFQKRFAVL
jgi:hypothetical protein